MFPCVRGDSGSWAIWVSKSACCDIQSALQILPDIKKSVGCQHDDIKVLKGTRDSLGPDPFRKRLGKSGGSGLMLRGKRKRAIPLSQKFSRNVILNSLSRNTGAMVYWGHDTMGLWAILVHPGQRLC